MQSGAATAICNSMGSEINNVCSKTSSSGAEEHVNFSLDLWKKALKDACDRICPVRAGGHECGCLRLLSKLVQSGPPFLPYCTCSYLRNHNMLLSVFVSLLKKI